MPRLAPLGCAAMLAWGLVACGRPTPPAPPAANVQQYVGVKGRVSMLPAPPAQEFMIHHEPIPGFISKEGVVVGMNEMQMPFPLGEGVSLEGLAVGDPVEFDFTVDWTGPRTFWITRIEKLPADTALNLNPG